MFLIQENVAFNLSVTQSIPTSNAQLMKTKLRTLVRKQILRKHIKKQGSKLKKSSGRLLATNRRNVVARCKFLVASL